MILRFSLGGAYYPESHPLDALPLDVDVRLHFRPVRPFAQRMDLAGTVRAERLAVRAEATGALLLALPGVHYRFDFRADDGRAVSLILSQSLSQVTMRSLTELSGHVTTRGGKTILGRARVRFDARRALGI